MKSSKWVKRADRSQAGFRQTSSRATKSYTYEEILKVMNEEIAHDRTPPSTLDWRELEDDLLDDE